MTPSLNAIQEQTDSFDYIKIKGKMDCIAKNTINKCERQRKCKKIFTTCILDRELVSLNIKIIFKFQDETQKSNGKMNMRQEQFLKRDKLTHKHTESV